MLATSPDCDKTTLNLMQPKNADRTDYTDWESVCQQVLTWTVLAQRRSISKAIFSNRREEKMKNVRAYIPRSPSHHPYTGKIGCKVLGQCVHSALSTLYSALSHRCIAGFFFHWSPTDCVSVREDTLPMSASTPIPIPPPHTGMCTHY